ncbi:hypothetical protein MRB53_017610 [Persea americana]|uniref:Uncharacterized protein n=1 Tax=Persea americana TaxID=3435 RepID=A0ACC2M557_PERAE|nr:hypothetical protein MRB53_017610 [Persea americana]
MPEAKMGRERKQWGREREEMEGRRGICSHPGPVAAASPVQRRRTVLPSNIFFSATKKSKVQPIAPAAATDAMMYLDVMNHDVQTAKL